MVISELPYILDSNHNIKNNDYTNARVKVKKRLWNIFKGIVSIENINISDALDDAIITWLTQKTKYINHKCEKCNLNININNYVLIFKNDKMLYYCSLKCLNTDID